MTKPELDQDEQALLAAFDADEFESVITEDRKSYLMRNVDYFTSGQTGINPRCFTNGLKL